MHLQGVARIDGLDRFGQPLDVPLHTCDRHRRINRRGVRPTRTVLHPNEWFVFEHHRVTTIARAAYDEMCCAPNLTEAVVVLDLAISRVNNGARTTLESVRTLVARHKKTRGIRRARAAIELASERSASELETRTRLVIAPTLDGADLVVNRPVFDRQGRLLGIPDLLDQRCGLVIESDGSQHGSVEGRTSDHQRDDVFENHGLTVARVTSSHHKNPAQLIARIRSDHRRAKSRRASGSPRWTLDEPAWWPDSALARRWG